VTAGAQALAELIERYEAAELRLDGKVREANSATKALKQATREALDAADFIRETATVAVRDGMSGGIGRVVEEELDGYKQSIVDGREDAVRRITASFDHMAAILKGEDPSVHRDPSMPSIPEIVERIRQERGHG
jgi:hypothetical protein